MNLTCFGGRKKWFFFLNRKQICCKCSYDLQFVLGELQKLNIYFTGFLTPGFYLNQRIFEDNKKNFNDLELAADLLQSVVVKIEVISLKCSGGLKYGTDHLWGLLNLEMYFTQSLTKDIS